MNHTAKSYCTEVVFCNCTCTRPTAKARCVTLREKQSRSALHFLWNVSEKNMQSLPCESKTLDEYQLQHNQEDAKWQAEVLQA